MAAVALAIVATIGAIQVVSGLRDGELSPPRAAHPSPSPTASADAEAEIRYACTPGHASFTVRDIETAPPADARDDGAVAVLLSLMGPATHLPEDGWRRVVDGPQEVVFLADGPPDGSPYSVVQVVPGGAGSAQFDGWGADSYGACTPRPVVPDDRRIAPWFVDPAEIPLDPASNSIPVIVAEQACSGGRTAEDRILPPSIVDGTDTVTVTIAVRVIGGDCMSNPPTPYVIELDEPLGERSLLDGGSYPLGDPFSIPD